MIDDIINNCLVKSGIEPCDIEIEVPKHDTLGDLSTPVAMALAKKLKRAPKFIAASIVEHLQKEPAFSSVEVAGPGFINMYLNEKFLYSEIKRLYADRANFLKKNIGGGKRVQVEFVSANPTGPLHLGHGRGAAFGNALCNLLEAAGFSVEREFYINDAGQQIKNLGFSVFVRYQNLLGNNIELTEDCYKGDYIVDIATQILENHGKEFYDKPFANDEVASFFSDYSYKKMLAKLKEDLSEFGVRFDTWQSERELFDNQIVEKTITDLKDTGSMEEKESALWFKSTRYGDEKDRVVIKSDGQYTYFASDIAYHNQKVKRGFTELINIWGADHHGYIPRVKAAIAALGEGPEILSVLLVQMVSLLRAGKPISMSKRSGDFISLTDVINEIGSDITKFIFLTRKADSHLNFDLELVKQSSAENPVFYVQYAYARINSIIKKAESEGFKPLETVEDIDLSLLNAPEELRLIKKLLYYPLVFQSAVRTREPHKITFYLQELSSLFHPYYNSYRVLVEEKGLLNARMFLCLCIKIVIEEGAKILGVTVPKERM